MSEVQRHIAFTEGKENLDQIIDAVRRQWPSASLDLIQLSPAMHPGFFLAIYNDSRGKFSPDSELIINATIVLGRVYRETAGEDRAKIMPYWINDALRLSRTL